MKISRSFKNKVLPFTALLLGILQIALVLLSWIITSMLPSSPVKSLLGSEGIRWFLGSFTTIMSGPLLVWLLLCAVAWGSFVYGGLYDAIKRVVCGHAVTYRQRHALFTVAVSVVVIFVIVAMLAFVPHAVLLGVTGSLFPSAFSVGLVPMLAFSMTFLSVLYGVISGRLTDINLAFKSLYVGLYMSAPLWPVYILAVQLYASVRYVFF